MPPSLNELLLKRAYGRLPRCYTAVLERLQRRRFGGRRKPARLDVTTSVGGTDADVLQVMLLSLSRAHPQDRIEFWLMHLRLTALRLEELDAFCATLPNLHLHEVRVPDSVNFALLSKLGAALIAAWQQLHPRP